MKQEELTIGSKVYFIRHDSIQVGTIVEKQSKQILINRDATINGNVEPQIKDIFECTVAYKQQSETSLSTLRISDEHINKLFESKQDLIKSL